MAAHMKEQVVKVKTRPDFSKQLISDIRWILWAVTIGGLLLAAYCIHKGYEGSLPWVAGMVSGAWASHGTVCSFYLNMAKSDHKEGGITFESARANSFAADDGGGNSPAI